MPTIEEYINYINMRGKKLFIHAGVTLDEAIDGVLENAARYFGSEIMPKETVNHPAHYNISGRKECIDEMIEKFGVDKVMAFCELNAYKYEYRHELKGGEEDLQKADWYRNKLAELGKQKWDKYKL